jgi:hypothetical protein
VRDAGAASYDFHPMSAGDLPLMLRWLEMPHIREWWGDPETELGYVRDMIEGRDTTRPFIFSVDGEPMGYIQYWFIGDHQNATWIADHPWLAELPSDAVGVDLRSRQAGEGNWLRGPARIRRAPGRARIPHHRHRSRSREQACGARL